MLDIQFIRDNPELVAEKSKQKGYEVDIPQLLGFDDKRRQLLQTVEELRRQRNDLNTENKGQKPSEAQLSAGRKIKEQLGDLEHQLNAVEKEFLTLLKKVPNMPESDVPVGTSEDENVVSKQWGTRPSFDFEPKNHWEIGEARELIDARRVLDLLDLPRRLERSTGKQCVEADRPEISGAQ